MITTVLSQSEGGQVVLESQTSFDNLVQRCDFRYNELILHGFSFVFSLIQYTASWCGAPAVI